MILMLMTFTFKDKIRFHWHMKDTTFVVESKKSYFRSCEYEYKKDTRINYFDLLVWIKDWHSYFLRTYDEKRFFFIYIDIGWNLPSIENFDSKICFPSEIAKNKPVCIVCNNNIQISNRFQTRFNALSAI